MKKSITTTLLLLFMAFVYVAQAQSLDNILKNHYKAVGQDKLAAASSFHIKAKISQMGMELPLDMKIKKPKMFRIEMEMQGQKMIQAFDGENGWMVAPWVSTEPTDLSGDQLKQALDQADVEGELYKYKEKGFSAEYIGKVNADGKEAFKIKLTTKDGTAKDYFIDANTYLVIKVKAKVETQGQTVDVEQRMSEYKTINGVTMATKLESDSPMGTAVILIEEFNFDEKYDNSIFKKPVK